MFSVNIIYVSRRVIILQHMEFIGAWGGVVVKVLRYYSDDPGTDFCIRNRINKDAFYNNKKFPVVSLGIFSVVPPTEPRALRSTHPLKVSIRDISWGKVSRCFWLTNLPPL